MASNNSGTLIKLGLAAAAGWYAYKQGWLSFLGIGTAATSTPASGTATPVTTPITPVNANPITGANTVAGVQARTIAAANAPAAGLAVDEWGYFLNQQLAPMGFSAPDPMPIFQTAVPGFDRSQVLTQGQYWAVMAPALKAQLGLSGMGLAGFGRVW